MAVGLIIASQFEGSAVSFGMNKEWASIAGYEDLYEVHSDGFVRSIVPSKQWPLGNHVLKHALAGRGYTFVCLYKNKKSKAHYIHRLVMHAFAGYSDLDVNHKDGIKTNNTLANLEYVTKSENMRHAWNLGLLPKAPHRPGLLNNRCSSSEDQIRHVSQLLKSGLSASQAAKQAGVSYNTAYSVKVGRGWKCLNLASPAAERAIGQ